jgi:hypothetical protein
MFAWFIEVPSGLLFYSSTEMVSPLHLYFLLFFTYGFALKLVEGGWANSYLVRAAHVVRSGDGWQEADLTSQHPLFPVPHSLHHNQWPHGILVARWTVLPPIGLCAPMRAIPVAPSSRIGLCALSRGNPVAPSIDIGSECAPGIALLLFGCGTIDIGLAPYFTHFQLK